MLKDSKSQDSVSALGAEYPHRHAACQADLQVDAYSNQVNKGMDGVRLANATVMVVPMNA